MPLKVYNDLTKQKEEFQPLGPPRVKMYVCGITPYDETHLGHARAYMTFDVMRRYLEYSGYEVTYIQNITDIDDKIIKKSREQGISPGELVDKYTDSYFEVMDKLNVRRAGDYPKATEHIPEMIKWIGGLVDRGLAYVLEDGVYFEVDKFKDYGKLSGRKKESMEAGARVEVDINKRNPLDFVLWKKAKEGEPSWDSPWGKGRPGWHIECSVMSTKYLGEQFDIHGGGLDLQFPHHENEIAQTEAITGKVPWVKYWLHNGFVTVNHQKMSKSLGNFFTLKDIFLKFDPMVVRLFLLSTHYRSPINYSDQELSAAKEAYGRLVNTLDNLEFLISKIPEPEAEVEVEETEDELAEFRNKFEEAMDDDFNAAGALGAIFELVYFINEHVKEQKIDKESLKDDREMLVDLCGILGLKVESGKLSALGGDNREIEAMMAEREAARKGKDFKKADQIRKELEKRGIIVEDTPYGPKYIKNA